VGFSVEKGEKPCTANVQKGDHTGMLGQQRDGGWTILVAWRNLQENSEMEDCKDWIELI